MPFRQFNEHVAGTQNPEETMGRPGVLGMIFLIPKKEDN